MSETKKWKFNRRYFLGILIVLALIGLALRFFWNRHEFRYAGTLEAMQVGVPARVASVISSIEVQEGQKVAKNQLLIRLTCEDVEIAARLAKINFTRASKLFRAGALTRDQYDQISTQNQEAQTRFGWCEIKSPTNGIVDTKYQEVGEWVNPGAKLLELIDLSDVWAYIYVPQPLIHQLKPGMKLTGLLPEMKNQKFSGTIRKINAEAEFTPKNVQTQEERTRLVYGVKVGFDNPEEVLKPGMTIEVQLPEQ